VSARGVHLALAPAAQWRLHAAAEQGDDEVWELIFEDLEEETPAEWQFATDKAWDALHRCLSNGELTDEGKGPLDLAIIGGIQLVKGDSGIVSVKAAKELTAIADALEGVTKEWLRARYDALDAADYGTPLSDEDFDYTWSSFDGLAAFYRRAATARDRAVVFTVDF
jgi:hypothetical protein